MIESLSGATDPPSPVTSVVMPWKIFEGRCGFTRIVSSDWPSMSMNPGATTIPCASTRRVAAEPASRPIAAIRPPRIPTSAAYQGEPVPSMTWPFAITTSNGAASPGPERAGDAQPAAAIRIPSANGAPVTCRGGMDGSSAWGAAKGPAPQIYASGAAVERVHELAELRRVEVGDGPELHAVVAPVDGVVAAFARHRHGFQRRPRTSGGPRVDVDHVLPPPVDERGHRASAQRVHPASGQREARAVQERHLRRKVHPAVEPGLHGMLVGRDDVGEVAGHQGAYVLLDHVVLHGVRG